MESREVTEVCLIRHSVIYMNDTQKLEKTK